VAFPKVKISDDSGNTVGVDTSSNALNVKLVESIDVGTIGDVQILGNDVLVSGAINVTDSAVQLTNATCKHVDIMANLSNTGIVYIGGAGVDATKGIALYPGDVYSAAISDLNQFYVMSTVDGDDINVQIFT
jgi:Neuraminidase (sialidase)